MCDPPELPKLMPQSAKRSWEQAHLYSLGMTIYYAAEYNRASSALPHVRCTAFRHASAHSPAAQRASSRLPSLPSPSLLPPFPLSLSSPHSIPRRSTSSSRTCARTTRKHGLGERAPRPSCSATCPFPTRPLSLTARRPCPSPHPPLRSSIEHVRREARLQRPSAQTYSDTLGAFFATVAYRSGASAHTGAGRPNTGDSDSFSHMGELDTTLAQLASPGAAATPAHQLHAPSPASQRHLLRRADRHGSPYAYQQRRAAGGASPFVGSPLQPADRSRRTPHVSFAGPTAAASSPRPPSQQALLKSFVERTFPPAFPAFFF